MPRRLSKWWRFLTGLFPLSFGGLLLVSVLGSGFYFIGLKRSDLLLAVASGCMLAAAILTTLVVIFTALVTVRRWPKDTPSVNSLEVAARGWTGLVVRPFWFPLVEVLWNWDSPTGVDVDNLKGREGLEEVVLPQRRGLYESVTRRILVRDVLGISNISWSRTETADLRILPSQGKLHVDSLVQSLFSGDDQSDPRGEPHGDRVDMRRYAPGDPPRLILWKVFARTRKLMVRVPERAVVTQPRTCAYLVSGPQRPGLRRHDALGARARPLGAGVEIWGRRQCGLRRRPSRGADLFVALRKPRSGTG